MELPGALATAAILLSAAPVAAQEVSDAEAQRMMAELQASHVEANVPAEADFHRILERDLTAYFEAAGMRNPAVRFELLRRGATQSGMAYPKFYLWVRVASDPGRATSGVVQVAAVDRVGFEIIHFLSATDIIEEPGQVRTVFPAPLVQPILDRAAPGVLRSEN